MTGTIPAMFKAPLRTLCLIAALWPPLALAQQFPTVPPNTVIGRLGAGTSGPSQAIPLAALQSAIYGNFLIQSTQSGQGYVGIGNYIPDGLTRWPGTKIPLLLLDRLVNWSLVNDNTVADLTNLAPPDSTNNQYASFSSRLYSTSNKNFNHFAGFEDLKIYAGVSPAVLSMDWSFLSNPTYSGTAAVTRREAFGAYDVVGSGTMPTTQVGFYCNGFTKASTNWCLYMDGTTKNFLGGDLQIGVTSPAASTSRSLFLNGATSGSGGGSGIFGNNQNWAVGNASWMIGGAYDATLIFSSSTNAFRFYNLTAGFMKTDANGNVSIGTLGTGVATAMGNNTNANGGLPTYSQGTFTPTITTSGTVGTPTYSAQVGSYEQIGRQVSLRFTIGLSAWSGSPTGNISFITGLPASANTANDFGVCYITAYALTGLTGSNDGIGGYVLYNTSIVTPLQVGNTATSNITAAQAGPTMQMTVWCQYHT